MTFFPSLSSLSSLSSILSSLLLPLSFSKIAILIKAEADTCFSLAAFLTLSISLSSILKEYISFLGILFPCFFLFQNRSYSNLPCSPLSIFRFASLKVASGIIRGYFSCLSSRSSSIVNICTLGYFLPPRDSGS